MCNCFMQDSPDTARDLLSLQAKRWLTAAGALVEPNNTSNEQENLCEISALLSYDGEGLEKFAGKNISLPCLIE